MPLGTGSRLGPYEILAPIGAGGMGEVYRARDTRLDRTVAIKVLPSHLSADPELRQRLEREARAVSSLNHPHICTLHDIGSQDGVDFLVMEHLEGDTLGSRLQNGPLRIEEALRYATQIADALDKAHRNGVIHRDLKPGNVFLTKTGAKLLDFGLAKSLGVGSPVSGSSPSPAAPLPLTAAPTASSPLTAEGTIVGTFHYMAPEQLEGRPADARSDIFAFGAVLYEMVTGRRAFDGKTQASLIAAILKDEPRPISALQPMAPPVLERLITTCLEKDPDERRQSMHDVLLELRWIAAQGTQPAATSPAEARPRTRERLWMTACLVFLLLAAGLGAAVVLLRRPSEPARMVRFVIPATGGVSWRPWNSMSLSPDGRRIVFFGEGSDGASRFWMRSLDSLDLQPLAGTDTGNASFPFWSPDSRSIGFFASSKLKRLDISGGPPQTVCAAPDGRGGTWNRDGIIVFSPASGSGLLRVPASGGEPAPVTRIDPSHPTGGHQWPSFLPDGRHFTYLSVGAAKDETWVHLGSLDAPEPTRLFGADSGAVYAAPGRLLFLREGTLLAQPFDPVALRITGDPVPVAEKVSRNTDTLYAAYAVSESGALLYKSGSDSIKQVAWIDRSGRRLGALGLKGELGNPELSPDGTRLALDRVEPNSVSADIWVVDLSRGTASRLTFEPSDEVRPLWSPDGSRILFAADREGRRGIFQKDASGASGEALLIESNDLQAPADVSADGKFLVYVTGSLQGDLRLLPLSGDLTPRSFLSTPFDERHARVSPDGRWIAYDSDDSARYEVYVQSFPQPGGKWQISTAGGVQPRWRRDGKELYYLAPDRSLMAVPVKGGGATFEAGIPEALFTTELPVLTGPTRYAVAGDGQRFLVTIPEGDPTPAPITVVLNWAGEPK